MQHIEIPRIGYGTYGRSGSGGIAAIRTALDAGYRHLDTAQSYETEKETGAGLRESGLDRDEVFITTKVTQANYAPGCLVPSLRDSCEALGVERVDLTLLHWPAPNGDRPLTAYLPQLLEAQEQGLTRLIGVSNFPIALLEEAERIAGPNRISTNQVECNILFQNKILADYCGRKGILLTCYQPIAHGNATTDPAMMEIARELDATPAQVALAWCLAKGYAAIPTSSKPARIRENFGATRVTLSPGHLARIAKIPQHPRSIAPDWGPEWDALE
ncbi:aldo/keto reductase [Celeribacter sp.]|uniref:aldo/keto reductase n=1 Tax=Celeribacter sp. TaxID=1890673 RepID=UPI003A93639E